VIDSKTKRQQSMNEKTIPLNLVTV